MTAYRKSHSDLKHVLQAHPKEGIDHLSCHPLGRRMPVTLTDAVGADPVQDQRDWDHNCLYRSLKPDGDVLN